MLSIGTNYSAPATSGFKNVVNMEMPDVSDHAKAGQKGGPSIDVSISPEARAMLNLDTRSLAAKGYSSVNIDTDGRPGAEITVDLTGDNVPANVTVSGGGSTGDPAGLLAGLIGESDEERDALSFLLKVLEELAEQAGAAQGKDPLKTLLDAIAELSKQEGKEGTAGAALTILLKSAGSPTALQDAQQEAAEQSK